MGGNDRARRQELAGRFDAGEERPARVAAHVQHQRPQPLLLQARQRVGQLARRRGLELGHAQVADAVAAGNHPPAVHRRGGERDAHLGHQTGRRRHELETVEPALGVAEGVGEVRRAEQHRPVVHPGDAVAAAQRRVERRPRPGRHAVHEQAVGVEPEEQPVPGKVGGLVGDEFRREERGVLVEPGARPAQHLGGERGRHPGCECVLRRAEEPLQRRPRVVVVGDPSGGPIGAERAAEGVDLLRRRAGEVQRDERRAAERPVEFLDARRPQLLRRGAGRVGERAGQLADRLAEQLRRVAGRQRGDELLVRRVAVAAPLRGAACGVEQPLAGGRGGAVGRRQVEVGGEGGVPVAGPLGGGGLRAELGRRRAGGGGVVPEGRCGGATGGGEGEPGGEKDRDRREPAGCRPCRHHRVSRAVGLVG